MTRNTKRLIDIEQIIKDKNPKAAKWIPKFVVNYLKRITHQEEINAFIAEHGEKNALDFTKAIAEVFEVKVTITGLENIPKTGGVIAVSNHPLGGLDAMALVPQIEQIRADVKYIVNDLLLNVEALRDIFVGINKHGSQARESLRQVEEVFASEQLVMLFPSGLVSRKVAGEIIDLPWQKTFVTKARQYNHPIVPIHTSGSLSPFFYRLSKFRKWLGIKLNLEMLYLADEMFAYKGKHIRYSIGKPIDVKEFDTKMKDMEISNFVRKELYKLANQ